MEFLATVSSASDEESVTHRAVERVAEALEAEVAALVRDGTVVACVGFPFRGAPVENVLEVVRGRRRELEVPGAGLSAAIAVALEDESAGSLVLARSAADFSDDELSLLRGMARVLGLTLRTVRLLEAERELRERSDRQADANARLLSALQKRQRLLEKNSLIQRLISHRAPLEEILEAIVDAARELFGDEMVGLRMVDAEDSSYMTLVASSGVRGDVLRANARSRIGQGAGGRAIAEGRLVVIENYAASPHAMPDFAAESVQAAMAAPVHENRIVVGSLVVASLERGRKFSKEEQEMLIAFAEQTSLAITDAKTVDAMLHQALHDALTGLPNRVLFFDRLELALARRQRGHLAPFVLFLDLDRFKTVNDSLGHPAGDQLLVGVAQRLRTCLRPMDTAARLGGDEFAVLIDSVEKESDALSVAERIADVLRQPFSLTGKEVFVSASIGLARGEHSAADALRDADIAMYQAKTRGRDRYVVFEPAMRAGAAQRLNLEVSLQRAVERNELVLHYQPIVDLGTRAVYGIEALVRWNDPERGLVPPASFIPVAEETGVILVLGRWVLRESLRQLASWQHGREQPLVMTVNLSGRQLVQPGLVRHVRHLLDEFSVDPSCLVLEITESVLMHDSDTTVSRLRELRELGVSLAVDDFGTGYSSIRYLREFPLALLKIASSFIDDVGRDSEQAAIVRGIIDLASSFRMRVIAEGIESVDQLNQLALLRCDLGQGFLLGRPAPPVELTPILAAGRIDDTAIGSALAVS